MSYHSLNNCIGLLQESVGLLESSNDILHKTTADIPRIRNILLTKRVFGLVPETDLVDAKQSFREETSPKLEHILAKIEANTTKLQKRKTSLQNRYNLQQVRLQAGRSSKDSLSFLVSKYGDNDSKVMKLKLLRNKKERLKYSLSRIHLQRNKKESKGHLGNVPELSPP